MKNNNKIKQRFQTLTFSILLLSILFGIFSTINPTKIKAQAETQNINSFSNPLTLLEIPGEIKIEFQTGIYVGAESDFQVGEKIMILLRGYLLRAGSFQVIAEKTFYLISNSTGDVIWSRDMSTIGGGWNGGSGGRWERGFNWIPEKEDKYTAGIIFIQPYYENLQNNTNAVPFRVHKPGSVIGKVTESNHEIPIKDALVEAMLGNTVYSNTTTNSEGFYNMQIIPSGKYAIQVSKPGYKTYISDYIKTDYRIVNLNVSLTVLNVSSTNNTTIIPDNNIQPDSSPEPENTIPPIIKTSAQIKLEPKTSIVNQEVKVNMMIEPIPLITDYYRGLVLWMVDPTGHTYVKGPYLTDSNGTTSITYTPIIPGNYTFHLEYDGQLFNNKNSEYLASISPIVTLIVKSQDDIAESLNSTQNQSITNSQVVESVSIQPSSEEISSTSVSTTPIPTVEPSITPTQTPELQHSFQLPSTLEIVATVIIAVLSIGLIVNVVKKRRS